MFFEVKKVGFDEYRVRLADRTREKIRKILNWFYSAAGGVVIAYFYLRSKDNSK